MFRQPGTGSTTGGLFGNTTTPPAFRQPTNTQPSFGDFGTTNTSTNLFGTQQNAGTNLFGTNTGTSAFGQAHKPGFNFGTTSGTNLFGQPQQNAQQTTPFGQANTTTNTNLFGTTTVSFCAGFGNTNPTTVPVGTAVKFTPVITTDSMSKNGISHSISARHCYIAAMKEYESKSYEELRFEDYQLERKGPQTGLFGTSAQTSPFGSTSAGTSTAGTGFGSMSGGFGTTSQSGWTGLFGKPIIFGDKRIIKLARRRGCIRILSKTAAPTPLFGTSNTNQTAGTGFGSINTGQNTGFGFTFGSTQPNQSIGLFNQNKSAFNIPSTSTSTGFTGFGPQPATNTTTPLFGNKTTTTGFGTTSTFGTAAPFTFGPNTGFNSGTNAGSSLFNSSFKPAGQTTGFSFEATPASSTGLGTNTGLSLGGGSSLFGQQKPGSRIVFGNTGNNTTFNNPGTFGSSTFGTNSNMMSGTGVGLLNGGVASNQAKANGSVPDQQILALVSAPFGDSPLLKNLLPASGKTDELLKPTNPASKVLNSPQYRVTANNKSPKIKARVVSSAQLSKDSPQCQDTLQLVKKLCWDLLRCIIVQMHFLFDCIVEFAFGMYYDNKAKKVPPVKNKLLLESAVSLAEKIRTKKVTSEEIVKAYIERCKEVNGLINAIVESRYSEAIEEAKAVDDMIEYCVDLEKIRITQPFLGVPFTTKESNRVKGLIHSMGLSCRRNHCAEEDATAVRFLKEAGGILIATTNVPELNLWCESRNNLYGQTNNPYNTTRTVGGSSGGEAAIVSASGSPLSVVSDIGGSTRMPAFFNGLFGHKPSEGLTPMAGIGLCEKDYPDTIAAAGPLCRKTEDLIPFMKVLVGPNVTKLKLDEPVNVKNLKVFYQESSGDLRTSTVNRTMRATLKKAVQYFKELTGSATKIKIPGSEYSYKLWRYCMSCEDTNFKLNITDRKYVASASGEIYNLLTGNSQLTLAAIIKLIDEDILPRENAEWAKNTTAKAKQFLAEKLGDNGILFYPSAPFPASYHYSAYLRPFNFGYWCLFNALRFPTCQVPLGLDEQGLPVGIQVVAAPYNDHLCFAVAKELETAFGGWVPPS